MLRSRIADMEKGITSVWTSIGITSSPFVPAAERMRGRAGEDRRVPTRTASALDLANIATPAALAKLPNVGDVMYEIAQLHRRQAIDQRHSRRGVGGVRQSALPAVVEYFESLAKRRRNHVTMSRR